MLYLMIWFTTIIRNTYENVIFKKLKVELFL